MSAHDDLRRQLLRSLSTRRSAEGPARRPRRWRGRRRGGVAIAVLALVVGGGVAGATTQLLNGPGSLERARSLVQTAVTQAGSNPACQRAAVTFVDTQPIAAARSVFGSRTTPLTAQEQALVRRQTHGVVLSRSVRLVRARSGRWVLVYVTAAGGGPFTVADRATCDLAQRARLFELHPGDDVVRALARHLLAGQQRYRDPDGQMLVLALLDPRSSAGAAVGISNGRRPVPTGVILESSTAGYAGISVRGAATVRVTTKDPRARHPLSRTYPVRERLFAFTLPRNTGPVEVRQLAADGRTLAVQTEQARTRPRR